MKRMRVQVTKLRVEAKSYYKSENQPIEEVIDRWVNNNEQMYDERVHGYYTYNELAPYAEYHWSREHSRRSPEEWEELKESVRQGWDENDPIKFIIYRSSNRAKVGEGNHRLGIIFELFLESPAEFEEMFNNIPVQFIFYEG